MRWGDTMSTEQKAVRILVNPLLVQLLSFVEENQQQLLED
jgi:hypothetical protein